MSAPTKPRTWALIVPPSPGPETTAVRLVSTGEVWVRSGPIGGRNEWMAAGTTVFRTYESWHRLLFLAGGEIVDVTAEWEAAHAGGRS